MAETVASGDLQPFSGSSDPDSVRLWSTGISVSSVIARWKKLGHEKKEKIFPGSIGEKRGACAE